MGTSERGPFEGCVLMFENLLCNSCRIEWGLHRDSLPDRLWIGNDLQMDLSRRFIGVERTYEYSYECFMIIQSDSALQIERRTTLTQKGTGCLFFPLKLVIYLHSCLRSWNLHLRWSQRIAGLSECSSISASTFKNKNIHKTKSRRWLFSVGGSDVSWKNFLSNLYPPSLT